MAAQIGQQEIVTLLLAHGADPTVTTKVCQPAPSPHTSTHGAPKMAVTS